MSETLTYNGVLITAADLLNHANKERSILSRALLVRGVQERIISLQDLQKDHFWITEDLLGRWNTDGEVRAFMTKISGPQRAPKEVPVIPEVVEPKVLPVLIEYRGLSFDKESSMMWWNERSARLSHREMSVLPLFFDAPESVISRKAIYESAFGRSYVPGSQLPNKIMSDVRIRCLDLGLSPLPFIRVRGGYKLSITP